MYDKDSIIDLHEEGNCDSLPFDCFVCEEEGVEEDNDE